MRRERYSYAVKPHLDEGAPDGFVCRRFDTVKHLAAGRLGSPITNYYAPTADEALRLATLTETPNAR